MVVVVVFFFVLLSCGTPVMAEVVVEVEPTTTPLLVVLVLSIFSSELPSPRSVESLEIDAEKSDAHFFEISSRLRFVLAPNLAAI
jgi:hypothetical protein